MQGFSLEKALNGSGGVGSFDLLRFIFCRRCFKFVQSGRKSVSFSFCLIYSRFIRICRMNGAFMMKEVNRNDEYLKPSFAQ